MSKSKPNYDFNDPLFQMRKYIRWADEHVLMYEMLQKSDVIFWEVKEIETKLNIPRIYTVEYRIRSIIGVDEALNPIYGHNHVMELAIPTAYPLQPCTIYMKTQVWHPNIKSEGQFKGRVCGNVQNFGLNYSLPQLVLRVGEILQYKNYLAEFIPPYPEDEKVAKWVREVGEPRGIVNLKKLIFVDNTPLLRVDPDIAASYNDNGNTDLEGQTEVNNLAITPINPLMTGVDLLLTEPITETNKGETSMNVDPMNEVIPEVNSEKEGLPQVGDLPKIRISRRDDPPPSQPQEKIIIKPKG